MGADLYLESVFKANRDKWQPEFDAAVKVRDAIFKRIGDQTPEYVATHKRVMIAYDAMYSEGYFRDSYNDACFLWKIGLSWWTDVGNMTNKKGYLPIAKAKKFRKMVAETPLIEEAVRKLVDPDKPENGTYEQWVERFERDRADLVAILDKSIEMKEPIRCSI